jgi:hypothetical protein
MTKPDWHARGPNYGDSAFYPSALAGIYAKNRQVNFGDSALFRAAAKVTVWSLMQQSELSSWAGRPLQPSQARHQPHQPHDAGS